MAQFGDIHSLSGLDCGPLVNLLFNCFNFFFREKYRYGENKIVGNHQYNILENYMFSSIIHVYLKVGYQVLRYQIEYQVLRRVNIFTNISVTKQGSRMVLGSL